MSLIKINNSTYILKDGKEYVAGDVSKISSVMNSKGIDWKDIEQGFVELINNDHKVAEYGINGSFLYTMRAE